MVHHFQCFLQCFSLFIYLCLHVFYLAESVHIFWNFSDEFGSLWAVEWWRNMESCRGGKAVQCYLSPSGDVVTAGCSVGQMIVVFYIYVGEKCRGKVTVCYKPYILRFTQIVISIPRPMWSQLRGSLSHKAFRLLFYLCHGASSAMENKSWNARILNLKVVF